VAICDATTFEIICSPERTTAAAVSSHELSMPRMNVSAKYFHNSGLSDAPTRCHFEGVSGESPPQATDLWRQVEWESCSS
jgi:hypothetical protein